MHKKPWWPRSEGVLWQGHLNVMWVGSLSLRSHPAQYHERSDMERSIHMRRHETAADTTRSTCCWHEEQNLGHSGNSAGQWARVGTWVRDGESPLKCPGWSWHSNSRWYSEFCNLQQTNFHIENAVWPADDREIQIQMAFRRKKKASLPLLEKRGKQRER